MLDITERKYRELEMMELAKDLERAERERAESLRMERAARAEAEEANRLKDEFLAAVSHELGTPLTAILGWPHMCATTCSPRKSGARHRDHRATRKVQARLIEDLLDVGRIVSAKADARHRAHGHHAGRDGGRRERASARRGQAPAHGRSWCRRGRIRIGAAWCSGTPNVY